MIKIYISGYISPESSISAQAVSLISDFVETGNGFIGDTELEVFRIKMAEQKRR
ncbi:hypothetical protein SAMN02910456_01440 [Ruminococcaceae bacterium YRB3002]|nr:hypothetical protein SAMN02910456_01440 [Ruminococcaceae bacterium YRB3002]